MRIRRRTTLSRWRHWRSGPPLRVPAGADDVENASRRFLMYGVLPLWFVPAVADWIMHRRTGIEHTTGVRESAVHALMMTEAGVPVVAALTAKVNPLVLSLMGGAALAHGATALWDVSMAVEEREVRPVEQHIHSFLEVLPLTAAAFTACLHWDRVRAGFSRAHRRPDDWRLVPKDRPLPAPYLGAVAAGVGLFVVLPYAEEMWRCVRARRPQPPADAAAAADGTAAHAAA
ncbi:diguanylate cyclase [Streptomyces sp. LP05-1]|uniref:Diguanylate cyclase n=1 Tax=Streptomyces pyxinae TaxID=2970734 RepID=A0ABT2CIF9_9ACTN|nr:diguanylate cyclase [Streptomyces sp. LP05-1]MCS0636887.1 diguanylate cyclase [Streptomyces sp. LP05-1]